MPKHNDGLCHSDCGYIYDKVYFKMIEARKLGFIDCIGLGGYHVHHKPKPYTTLLLRRKGYRCVVCYKFWSIGYLRAMGALHD